MTINIQKKEIVLALTVIFVIAVIYLARDILAPFVLAAVFAYLLNPLINLLTHKTKISRTLAISIVYFILIGGLVALIFTVWSRFSQESIEFTKEARNFLTGANSQISSLPEWMRPIAVDLLDSGRTTLLLSPRRISTLLPLAVNRGVGILVFLVAMFYFLKDGLKFTENILRLFPNDLKFEIEVIVKKVNRVLGSYLRAQLLLIAIMSVLTFLVLSIIGVRYSVLLSIFTGVAETVPFVGPVVAAVLAMLVAYTDNYSHLGMDPVIQVLVVGLSYTILRQIEDLFVIPQVLSRTTKLHPMVVLFSALFGGHLFGVVGFIVAVPVVASLRVIVDHSLDLFNHKKTLQDE